MSNFNSNKGIKNGNNKNIDNDINKIIEIHRKNNNFNINSIIYPYYTSAIDFIKNLGNIKYFCNICFYALVFVFLTKADMLIRILIPINISNVIVAFLIVVSEFETMLYNILGNSKFKKISFDKRKQIIKEDYHIKKVFLIIFILYHLLILLITIIINHYYEGEYYPFLFIFGCSILLISGFLIISRRHLYGNIREQLYIVTYIFILFTLNYLLNTQELH